MKTVTKKLALGIKAQFLVPETLEEAGLTVDEAMELIHSHLINRIGLPRFWAEACALFAAATGKKRELREPVLQYLQRLGMTAPELQGLLQPLPPTPCMPTRNESSPSRAALRMARKLIRQRGLAWLEATSLKYGFRSNQPERELATMIERKIAEL